MTNDLHNALRVRSELLRAVREYFYSEGLLEVSTPTLREFGANEPHLANLAVQDGNRKLYLQTSPEYAMKYLLAEFNESIFQICPAYRSGEEGSRHRVEFQMLEWYRCGFDLRELMADVTQLLESVSRRLSEQLVDIDTFNFAKTVPSCVTYKSLFEDTFGLNPHDASVVSLAVLCEQNDIRHLDNTSDVEDYLDALYSTVIEPGLIEPTYVFDYPASQAALAEIGKNEDGDLVSFRFELYFRGLEIANAYQELIDADELAQRFDENNKKRSEKGLPLVEPDTTLLEAMKKMPECAGIALGIDRLLMTFMGLDSIDQAICSP